jgi:hypothetical protein
MTTYTYPPGRAYEPARMSWGMVPLVRKSSSMMSGATQVLQRPGGRWRVTLDYPEQQRKERSEVMGLFYALAGGAHKLALWDLSRPQPLGTIGTSGVTCQAVAQFAETIVLNASGMVTAGDKFGAGGQLFMAVQTVTGSGSITVPVRHMARAAISSGSAVTLIRPTTTFIPEQDAFDHPEGPGGICPAFSISLIEAF